MNEQKIYSLKAEKREITGKKVKSLRNDGFIPAVIYGHGTKPQSLSIRANEFKKIFSEAGTSSLVDLKIGESGAVKVLTHEPQYNPVTEAPMHIDFYKVRMDEKIKTEIPLEFVGESEAVEQLDGSLVTNRDNVEVECLPSDLISEIVVDLSVLKTFEDVINVSDLKIPSGIEIMTEKEEVIALVEPPRSEEELAELETPSAAEEEKEALEKMGAEGENAEGESEAEEGPEPEENKE
jgi:large subunit ribosomal protein L25